MITISATIMHTSSSSERRKALQQLLYQLSLQGAKDHWVSLDVKDDWLKQGPWYNAKRCWQIGEKSQATHHLHMQDDIRVCHNFVEGIKSVIAAFPDEIISIFHGPRKAFNGSARWGQSEGAWGQGIIMPVAMVKEFLIWERQNIDPCFPHDDSRVSLFAIKTGRRVFIPFPNLIDHRDDELKSILGNRWNKPRVSSDFMGDRDPANFDWNQKEPMMKSINSFTQYNKYLIR